MADTIAMTEIESDIASLTKKLAALPGNLEQKGARKATREAAKVTLEDARNLVPVDEGDLERSLKVRARKRSRRNKGTVGHAVVTGKEHLKGNEFYGSFVELGTSKMEADPFLRPALWGNKEEKLNAYRRVLVDWLNKDAPNAT